ncbi:hypothetical protein [Saccharopolyspora aridisoli]|nr:hypothetical protein [Saccharopolyspora aridisoli]
MQAHEACAEDDANQWPERLKLGDAMAYGGQVLESHANCLS